jgi:hypothetical protein
LIVRAGEKAAWQFIEYAGAVDLKAAYREFAAAETQETQP